MKLLTELQEKVLRSFFGLEETRRHFYLTGGTALSAFYLHHRYSDDLDFFTHSVDIPAVDRLIEDELKARGFDCFRERASPTYRRYIINKTLIVDVVRDVDWRLGAPQLIEGIMVDTPKNIAVNKVVAMYGRLEPKDYVDLYFLLRQEKYDILELLKLGENKDGGLEPFQWSRVIADVEVFSVLPRMVVPCTLEELKIFFRQLREKVVASCKPASP